MQFPPTIHAAGDRPGQKPRGRYLLQTFVGKDLAIQVERAAAGGIQAIELLGLGIPINDKQVPPDPATHRLDDSQHGIGRNGGIGRISP